ncbi:regulating synaptic membrane exocytosis protein 2 isoform X4 [Microplitis mediator]|uniref:regulating synaptic membrane exocytosis protein 2 isoform X4 n=1 Tax=Microplitis mediator TaxID=375433 RepID=UPI00255364CF|nr:regulating synaptic membrane exocytosis protein 2 isoform X4 [Microplitis mediator]
MADLPDMSHLTPEERRIIEEVMMRQKQEEDRENEIMRRKQDEVQILEETIRARSEKHKKAGIELDATCDICMKTKFADGVGHICNYCNIRCCARCGGKVTLRSNKVIWVCIVCRKKQELLSKTGQWMVKTGLGAADQAMIRRMQEDMHGGPLTHTELTQDKRPKLERAHSAAEKENLPLLQRSGSALRRQYSQQEQIPNRRLSTSDSGVEMSVSPHSRSLPTPHVVVGSYPQQTPRHPAAFPEDDPNIYRGELDGLMKQHAQTYQRSRQIYQEQNSNVPITYGHTGVDNSRVHQSQQHQIHQVPGKHLSQTLPPPGSNAGSLHQQRSFSSSEEERSTPECASDEPDESEKGKGYYHHVGGSASISGGSRRHGPHNGHHITGTGIITTEYNGHHPPREPRKEENTLVRRSFRRSDEWRADSRRFTERRGKKTVRFDGGTNVAGEEDWSWEADRQGSQDSATKDSGIDTSSTFTSSEDSNRGDLPKQSQASSDGQKIIVHMILRKSAGPGSILGLKVAGGQLLDDGRIGALIEKVKEGTPAAVDGQLRPGDEVIEWNGHCLQGKNSQEVANIIAESRDENQVELIVAKNHPDSTNNSITCSNLPSGTTTTSMIPQRRITAQAQWRQTHETMPILQQPHHRGLKKCILWELYDVRREKPSVLVTSPGSPDLHGQGRNRHPRYPTTNANVGGKLQVKLDFNPACNRLSVTVFRATELTPRSNGQLRNPYAKVYLLPDRNEMSKRRTKTLANTNDPRWNETFDYNIRKSELKRRWLEVSVWDFTIHEANDFLGEAVLELSNLSEKSQWQWQNLVAHEERRPIGQYHEPYDDIAITPVDYHLSPPSTTSRLSDSDTSEYDITDCDIPRDQRRTADGASISSLGSSSSHYSSPPPEREYGSLDNEHRSRRDMSSTGSKRAALMISRDQPVSISGYPQWRKDEPTARSMMGHRSHSAAPMDSPYLRYRGRSQSPTGHRSLSPPDHRSIPYSHGYMPARFGSRSATATPTGSPKKRQLPQTPLLKERMMTQDDERHRLMRYPHRLVHTTYRSTGIGGWERHYSGRSDSDLLSSMGHDPPLLPHAHRLHHRPRRGHLSPDKDVLGDFGDSDMESIISVASSAFSTQSERPRGSRALIPTVKNILVPSVISHLPSLPPLFIRRTRRKHKIKLPINNNNSNTISNNNNNNINNKSISIIKECSHYNPISNSIKTWKTPSNKYHNPATIINATITPTIKKPKPKITNTSSPNHLLVRSKSAVVRSMHRKPRVPIVRSQTVDDNLFRYTNLSNLSNSNTSNSSSNFMKDFCLNKYRDSSNITDDSTRIYNYYVYDDNNRDQCIDIDRRYSNKLLRDAPSCRCGTSSDRKNKLSLNSKVNYLNYNIVDDFFVDLRDRIKRIQVPRRAKSVEYESVSSNIFSDDSLRTARRKVKRNLTVTGDKLPYLNDQSKSYYDSTGDSSKNSESIVDDSDEFNNECRSNYRKKYYSLYVNDGNSDENLNDDHEIDNIIDAVEASNEYDRHLFKINSSKRLDSKYNKSNDDGDNHHPYGFIDNDHIYCSIDDNRGDCRYSSAHDTYDSSSLDNKVPKKYCDDKLASNDQNNYSCDSRSLCLTKRTKSTDSYLEDNYDTKYYDNYSNHGRDNYEDSRGRSRSFGGRTEPFISFEAAYDDTGPKSDRKSIKILEKAESSPTLHPEDDDICDTWESTRRMSRRRRNSSCPEARDIRNLESPLNETVSINFFMGSDDDFGSTETVVGPDYRKNSVKDVKSERFSSSVVPRDCDDDNFKAQIRTDRSGSYPGPARRDLNDDLDYSRSRKTSCPECRELYSNRRDSNYHYTYPDTRKSSSRGSINRSQEIYHDKYPQDSRQKKLQSQERKDLFGKKSNERRLAADEREQSGSKRNVAISDTLEYYEYSMESESQCSENCGFGPYDLSLRPRNRAPRPGNANSNIFDSQTATSDTAKNHPRVNDHHNDTIPRRKRRDPSMINDAANDDTGSSSKTAYKITTDSHSTKTSVDSVRINNNADNNPDADNFQRKRSSGDYNSPGGSYEKNTRHQVTDNGHNGHTKRGQFSRSLSNADGPPDEKVADGSLSDTAVGLHVEEAARRARKSSPGSKSGSGSSSGGGSASQYQAGLGKKSNSTSQLSATECISAVGVNPDSRSTGIPVTRKRNSTPSSFQRSQEVVPMYQRLGAAKQPGSVASDTAGSLNSISSSEASSWSPCLRSTGEGGQLSEFIDGLGPGQLVGRQVLGGSSLGDIQLALNYTKGYLEVEVVRARDLQPKPGSKVLPAPYVKVYLVNGKKCIAKAKTTTARKTLEPFYQQPLAFRENFQGCILQVTVWGDYGRLEGRKVFMGVAQIMLDDLNLNEMVFGWYKLFGTTSLVSGPPSVVLSRRSSATSLESLKL